MASKHFHFSNTILILLNTILFFSNPSLSTPNGTWHEAICNSTPHPSECASNLPRNHSGDARGIARFFVRKSLTVAADFLSLLDSYLEPRGHGGAPLPGPTVRALEDCRLLAELTLDSVARTHRAINLTDRLDALEAEDLETLLSAVLTNQETCLEGLGEVVAPSPVVRRALGAPITLGTKLYSISLALFKQGWVDSVDNDDDDDDDDEARDRRHDHRILRSVTRQRKLLANLGGVLVSQTAVVDRNGTGNFTTIGEAVDAAPNNTAVIGRGNNTSAYFVIYVVRGVYEEYVSIGSNKQNLMMIGDGINQTVITGNRSVGDGWTTFNSATFAVTGQGFVAINITFRNTAGAIKRQAVAVRNGADLSAFHGCSFEGHQDTLYAHSLRQFYSSCHVTGTVDFVFGNAAAVLQHCHVTPRLPLPGQFNAITAQGRSDPNQNTGFSVHACSVRAGPDLASAGPDGAAPTYLGRPWREYSRTVFMQSFMDASIDPAGWREWNGSFALSTLYYAEFNNTGPGRIPPPGSLGPGIAGRLASPMLRTSRSLISLLVMPGCLGPLLSLILLDCWFEYALIN